MAKLIRFPRHRAARPEPAVDAPVGDGDLAPAAVLLWLASVACVAGATADGGPFGAEATLALLCAVAVPGSFCWSWLERERRAKTKAPKDEPEGNTGGEVIKLVFHRASIGDGK